MAKKLTAKAKLVGIFPLSQTRCSYNVGISEKMTIALAHDFVKSFDATMMEMYGDQKNKPRLRKVTIMITLP
jgi:hypothetical protein